MLSSDQISYLLLLLSEKHGPGYSDKTVENVSIGTLQAALSIMLEMVTKKGK